MSRALPPEDRQLVDTLFERAAKLPGRERAQWVARECGARVALRDELLRLLAGLQGPDIVGRMWGEAPSRVGTYIGRYALLEKVGEGGMGEVYAAEQREPVVRRVALKIIRLGMDSAQGVARFELERQVLAQMAHPNVAQVLDGGAAADGSPYLVMEFVEGDPITGYCDRRKLSTRARIELFLGVCAGVQHAHQRGVVHRDLKPSNLLVTEVDGRAVPKVIDFGVARATSGLLAEATAQTLVGQIIGTLDYMSPEQADASGCVIDTRTDIYSLGVVLYQLLSGLLPFEHDTSGAIVLSDVQRAIREVEPPTPSKRLRRKTGTASAIAPLRGTDERSLLRQLSGDLDWVCMKALEKDPARRYQSASELASDLQRHLAHQPVLAGRPSALYRARKFVRRNRLGVAAGGLVTAGMVVGVLGIVSGRRAAEARTEELLQLSDGERWRALVADADTLWPPFPDQIPTYEEWLGRARALVDNIPLHRATRARLRGRASPQQGTERDIGDSTELEFANTEDDWQHRVVTELVTNLEALHSTLLHEDAITSEHGWSVPKRLALAQELAAAFAAGGEHARAWEAALPELRADYPGLDLRPQPGLVPIGKDPESGLWEFAHLASGRPAVRVDGKLVLTAETGLVVVLLRGGTYVRGAQSDDPAGDNYSPEARPAEGPPTEKLLDAFFLSKYELTQSQWARIVGAHPSNNDALIRPDGDFALDPVNLVTQAECARWLPRFGLVLPHEDQWEYGARAGTPTHAGDTPWGTGDDTTPGDDPRSLMGMANLCDLSVNPKLLEFMLRNNAGPQLPWNDGYQMAAPVGSFLPNAFGLHDMYGNVTECCSNSPGLDAEGGRDVPVRLHLRVARGGNWAVGSDPARSAFRFYCDVPDSAKPYSGVRPARPIDP